LTAPHESRPDQLTFVGRAKVPALAFVLLALQVLDLASTGLVLQLGGAERNGLLPLLGWKRGIAMKFFVVFLYGTLASVAPRWISMPGLRIACIIYTVVVLWNLVVAGALA
jgi:hypothetical protein